MDEKAKAVQESAKVAGKALDIVDKTGSFIANLIKGPLEQGIGIFEDKLKYSRYERQIRLMSRAKDIMREQNITVTRALPLKLAIPLLQGACWEDDDYLQDLWAQLLVNAIDDKKMEIKKIYIDILEGLTPLEVQILDKIYSLSFEEVQHQRLSTIALPHGILRVTEKIASEHEKYKLNDEKVKLALINLARLGCISFERTVGGGEIYSLIHVTLLGKYFCEACSIRK